MTLLKSLGRLFLTKEGRVVIGQRPNMPLIVAGAADEAAYFSHGNMRAVNRWTADASFIILGGM
ncbi:MAG: hypothetical protein ACYC96_04520 [Fimbriimonadaceae bacterium]